MADPFAMLHSPSISTLLNQFSPQSTIAFTITPFHFSLSILIFYHNQLLNLHSTAKAAPSPTSRQFDFIIAALQDLIIDLFNETHHSLTEPPLSALLTILSLRLTGPFGLTLQFLFKRTLLLTTHPSLLQNYLTQLSYCLPALSRPWASGITYQNESSFAIVLNLYISSLHHVFANPIATLLFQTQLYQFIYFDQEYVNFKTGGAFETAMRYTTALHENGFTSLPLTSPEQLTPKIGRNSPNSSEISPQENNFKSNRRLRRNRPFSRQFSAESTRTNAHTASNTSVQLNSTFQSISSQMHRHNMDHADHLFNTTQEDHTDRHLCQQQQQISNLHNTTTSSLVSTTQSIPFSFINSELSFRTNPAFNNTSNRLLNAFNTTLNNSITSTSTLQNTSAHQLPPLSSTQYENGIETRKTHSNIYSRHASNFARNRLARYPPQHTSSHSSSQSHNNHLTQFNPNYIPETPASTPTPLISPESPILFLTPHHQHLFQFYRMVLSAEKALYTETFHAFLKFTTFRPLYLFKTSDNLLLFPTLQSKMGLFFPTFTSLALQHVDAVPNQTQHQLLTLHTTSLYPLIQSLSNLTGSNTQSASSPPHNDTQDQTQHHGQFNSQNPSQLTSPSTSPLSPSSSPNIPSSIFPSSTSTANFSTSITSLSSSFLPTHHFLPKFDSDLETALHTLSTSQTILKTLFSSLSNPDNFPPLLEYLKSLQTKLRRLPDPVIDAEIQLFTSRLLPDTVITQLCSDGAPRTYFPSSSLVPLCSPPIDPASAETQNGAGLSVQKIQLLIDTPQRAPTLADLSTSLPTHLSYQLTTAAAISANSTASTGNASAPTSNPTPSPSSSNPTNLSSSISLTSSLSRSHLALSNPISSLFPTTHITSLENPVISQLYYHERALKLIQRNNPNYSRATRYSTLYDVYKIDQRYIHKLPFSASSLPLSTSDHEAPGIISPAAIYQDQAALYDGLGLKFTSLVASTKAKESLVNSLYTQKHPLNQGILVTMLDSHATDGMLGKSGGFRSKLHISLSAQYSLSNLLTTYLSPRSTRGSTCGVNCISTRMLQAVKYCYYRIMRREYDSILASLVQYSPTTTSSLIPSSTSERHLSSESHSNQHKTYTFSNLLPLVAQQPLYAAHWLYLPQNTSHLDFPTSQPSTTQSPPISQNSQNPPQPQQTQKNQKTHKAPTFVHSQNSLIYLYRYAELLRVSITLLDFHSMRATVQKLLQCVGYYYQQFRLSPLQSTSSPLFLLFHDIFHQISEYALLTSNPALSSIALQILIELHPSKAHQPHNIQNQLPSLLPYIHDLSFALYECETHGVKLKTSTAQNFLSNQSNAILTHHPFTYSAPPTPSTSFQNIMSALRTSLAGTPLLSIPALRPLPTRRSLSSPTSSPPPQSPPTPTSFNDSLSIIANPIVQTQIRIIINIFHQIWWSNTHSPSFTTPTTHLHIQTPLSLFSTLPTLLSFTTTHISTSTSNLNSHASSISSHSPTALKTARLVQSLIGILSILDIDALINATLPSPTLSSQSPTHPPQPLSITIPPPLAQILTLLSILFTFLLPNQQLVQQLLALCTPTLLSASSYHIWLTTTTLSSSSSSSSSSSPSPSSPSPSRNSHQLPPLQQLTRDQTTVYDEYLLMAWTLLAYNTISAIPTNFPTNSRHNPHNDLKTQHSSMKPGVNNAACTDFGDYTMLYRHLRRIVAYSLSAHHHSTYASFALYMLCRVAHQIDDLQTRDRMLEQLAQPQSLINVTTSHHISALAVPSIPQINDNNHSIHSKRSYHDSEILDSKLNQTNLDLIDCDDFDFRPSTQPHNQSPHQQEQEQEQHFDSYDDSLLNLALFM